MEKPQVMSADDGTSSDVAGSKDKTDNLEQELHMFRRQMVVVCQ